MCGIAGWVAFDQDLTERREVLAAMTGTMACRGPDAGGTHLSAHAALGHRRLAVIDVEGGTQPMTFEEDGRPLVTLTYSGEVYNHLELRAELEAHGHRFRTRSDTEVVLHAYLRWGRDFVERLNGMFAFALWDARDEELLLVRDRMGVKPLYYFPTADGVLFGSEPKAILAHPAVAAVVDLDGLRELLSMVKTPGRAVYRGMSEVRPGHLLRVRREGLTDHRYWALTAREHTDDLSTTVATVRELLDDIVRRQLISDVPLCSLLSGGLDSSAITALAARGLAAEGRGPVRSFSVDFVGQTENFRPDDLRATPDAPFAHLLAQHVAAEHRDIVLDAGALADPANRAAVLRAGDLPTGFGDMDTSLYLLFKEIRKHSTVALSGESADEVFGGYPWFHEREAVYGGTFPWHAAGAVQRLGGPGAAPRASLLDPDLVARLDLSTYIADSYADALAEVPHLPVADPHERRMREVCHLHLTRFVRTLLDRKDRMSMASGLEVRVPFCDHRLVEYVFNTPWSMKTFDGREKSLLRAAVAEVLPREIVTRVKSPYPSTQDPGYPLALRAELAALATDPKAPGQALADPAAVAAALAPDRDPQTARAAAEVLLGLDRWLRAYPVSLRL
ncbi:asparagine synthase (glutamine-hydrolyzing) [Kitasatospora sp. NBC_01287]|uniref:asparagine synthase (glutamine-hydrolyzing) n=1 Tax=Kitasatospora sp. NBC_01287 TaxID=2903573 RepID=UPI00225A8E71|nr:asparagine synthase (glutamine-hydrolyzing) [Kitasatospora sp. NBC_01287]MCX4751402.1 asparagine synthase (glutamine-hydrolyzing) [Kitasatospora sp. NBC_01287]